MTWPEVPDQTIEWTPEMSARLRELFDLYQVTSVPSVRDPREMIAFLPHA